MVPSICPEPAQPDQAASAVWNTPGRPAGMTRRQPDRTTLPPTTRRGSGRVGSGQPGRVPRLTASHLAGDHDVGRGERLRVSGVLRVTVRHPRAGGFTETRIAGAELAPRAGPGQCASAHSSVPWHDTAAAAKYPPAPGAAAATPAGAVGDARHHTSTATAASPHAGDTHAGDTHAGTRRPPPKSAARGGRTAPPYRRSGRRTTRVVRRLSRPAVRRGPGGTTSRPDGGGQSRPASVRRMLCRNPSVGDIVRWARLCGQ